MSWAQSKNKIKGPNLLSMCGYAVENHGVNFHYNSNLPTAIREQEKACSLMALLYLSLSLLLMSCIHFIFFLFYIFIIFIFYIVRFVIFILFPVPFILVIFSLFIIVLHSHVKIWIDLWIHISIDSNRWKMNSSYLVNTKKKRRSIGNIPK